MFGRRVTLFELLGFKINVDLSWIFLAVFITWSLSVSYFPFQHENYGETTYWAMGVFGSLGLFASIIFHELSHSLVARRYGLKIKGITLFIFGGVAEMESEPPSAISEFLMAIAGPIASLILAAGFYQVADFSEGIAAPEPFIGVIRYLALINAVLAVFNMIPAFPLDGGRALRAAMWHFTGDVRQATQRAAGIGSMFGLFFIAVGVLTIISGYFITGLWWSLIGLFLRGAAQASASEVNLRTSFESEPIAKFMSTNVVAVSPDISVLQLVEDFIYQYHFDMFPATEQGVLLGCVSTKQVREVPRADWDIVKVGDIMVPLSADNTIDVKDNALKALTIMRRTGSGRLIVVDQGILVGILVLKDMLKLLALKENLEGSGSHGLGSCD